MSDPLQSDRDLEPPAEFAPIREELIHASETIERRAWGALAGDDGAETDGLVQLITPEVDHLLFNRILGLDTRREVPAATLDAMIRRFREHGVARFFVHELPGEHHQELGPVLERHGLEKFRRSWLKLALRLENPVAPVTGVEIRPMTAVEAGRAADILMAGFDIPATASRHVQAMFADERLYNRVAIVDGQVAGVGVVFIDPPAAYLSMAATAPEFRQRGIQKALMLRRLALAAELGCEWVFTETGAPVGDEPNPSLRNMHTCGFAPLYLLDNYAPEGTRW